MFNLFGSKKKQTENTTNTIRTLYAAAEGEIISLADVPDEVFSQKILGDGYAIRPSQGNIYSPADGIVTEVYDTNHAYCITSRDNLEILVHIGIDTVELKGNGFSPLVKKGAVVSFNTPIASVDLDFIKEQGFNTEIMVVITNADTLKSINVSSKANVHPGDIALTYTL